MKKIRQWSVHLVRVAILGCILMVIHLQHDRLRSIERSQSVSRVDWSRVVAFFPQAAKWGEPESHGGRGVLAADGTSLGYLIQTAPESDPFLGFSGPSNLLIAMNRDDRILGIELLSTGDTRDHVNLIVKHKPFFGSWVGMSWSEAASRKGVDGVAGATLTSFAMAQGIQKRLGAFDVLGKFQKTLELTAVRQFFPNCVRIEQDNSMRSLWYAYDARSQVCGSVLRTTPAADDIIGYQGPTECHIAFLLDGSIVGVAIASSFDNEPYVGYIKGDEWFANVLKKYSMRQWSQLDLEQAQVEGVSGATMTSMAVARGMIAAAAKHESELAAMQSSPPTNWNGLGRSISTIAIVSFGLAFGLSSLRGSSRVRVAFQIVVIVYLGFINGDLLSMGMIVGWAQSGIPYQNAIGLVFLAIAAIVLPIVSRSNIYCSHLCPHGAIQQLLPRRWKMKSAMPRTLVRFLNWIRPALIAWVLLVTLMQLPFSLVDIEPFDAYAWRSAAWPTVLVAAIGIAASFRVPMAYCRFGCGTGAILQYLRRHSRSDRFTLADLLAMLLLSAGFLLYLIRIPA